MSPEVQSRIAILREKSANGTATIEEMREAVRLLRGDRKSAAVASEVSRARKTQAKAAIPSADDMLSELGE